MPATTNRFVSARFAAECLAYVVAIVSVALSLSAATGSYYPQWHILVVVLVAAFITFGLLLSGYLVLDRTQSYGVLGAMGVLFIGIPTLCLFYLGVWLCPRVPSWARWTTVGLVVVVAIATGHAFARRQATLATERANALPPRTPE